MNLSENIRRYIDAGFPILYLNSFEERVLDECIRKAAEASGGVGRILEWNGVGGFVDFKTKRSLGMDNNSLSGVLNFLLDSGELESREQEGKEQGDNVLIIKDAAPLLDEPDVVAALRGVAEGICCGTLACTVIIESVVRTIPRELEPYITILEMDYLTTEEIRGIIRTFVLEQGAVISDILLNEMAVAFKGLSRFEIVNLLALSFQDDGELTRKDLELIFEQKRQMVLKSGILEMVPLKESLEDIGGLENLKKWLRRKAVVLKNIDRAADFGVDIPKGVLIAGIPGCGKSLNAKAAAKLFEVPLLRLDMGRLMGKYVGESEGNMRKAIKMAEAIAPCVLWVDELEKAFAGVSGNGGDSGVSTRLFGNFLTWLQEKESPVFVVATANDISKLPPELLRKGRFDEIFYVSLPNRAEREKIFEIHIGKRRKPDLGNIRIDKLVAMTDGYSGADIEGVVKESIETVYSDGRSALCTDDIVKVIKSTHSLKELLADSLKTMTEVYEKGNFKKASLDAGSFGGGDSSRETLKI